MPNYTDANGNIWNIEDWPGHSYKATVINRAYRKNQFVVETVRGNQITFFECAWCRRLITSAGVQGDHVAGQNLQHGNREMRDLFSNERYNLELSCSECNGGTRNYQGRTLRSRFVNDRERQDAR